MDTIAPMDDNQICTIAMKLKEMFIEHRVSFDDASKVFLAAMGLTYGLNPDYVLQDKELEEKKVPEWLKED